MNLHCLLLLLTVCICKGSNTNNLKLKQVVIFSRHNIRTPMGTELQRYTPKKLPYLLEKPGRLTRKGALLEGYMGEYFSEWFKSEQLLTEKCPSADTVYVYANSLNRTLVTAKAFVKSAFKGCNVTVNHKITNSDEESDPDFDQIISNNTDAFKTMVLEEIFCSLENKNLSASLAVLNKILDFKHSEICQTKSICDLTDSTKNGFTFENGSLRLMEGGPVHIGLTITDLFIMRYYDGLPMEDIALSLVREPATWKLINEIAVFYKYIIYGVLSKYIKLPLLQLLTSTFNDIMPKVTTIVGHDFNQENLVIAMNFIEKELPNQFEKFPIGGKIVFQRWTDDKNDYLKIEYIYASWAQVRNGTKFTTEDPPQRVLRELKRCSVDENGFCPWNEFMNIIRDLN